MLAISSGIAVGTCALMTPYWFFSSSRAAGTILKLAAIGVISVPQKPASMPDRADHRRVAAVLVDQDRNADRGDHHRERREGIAHDHREHDHAESIEQHREEDAAVRNDRADDRADGRADTGRRENRAQRREHLRQHHRPADRIGQPATFVDRGKRRRTKPGIGNDQAR